MKRLARVMSSVIVFALFGGLLLLLGQVVERSSTKLRPSQTGAQPVTTVESAETPQALTQPTVVVTATEVQPTLAPATLLQYATLTIRKDYTPGVGGDTPAVDYSYFRVRAGGDLKSIEAPVPVEIPRTIKFNPWGIFPAPSGKYVVFMQPVMPGGIPYALDVASGKVQPLYAEFGGGRFFGWHPDGLHFLYWVEDEQVGLRLVNAATLETQKLVAPKWLVQGAAISPDGKRIAYIDGVEPMPSQALWLINTEGGDAKSILKPSLSAYMTLDAWSPDGKRLIYQGECEPEASNNKGQGPNSSSFCILDVDTSKAHGIANPKVGEDPKWSPDGRMIATTGIASDEKPCEVRSPVLSVPESLVDTCKFTGFSIFLVDVATGESKEITRGISPTWSPDGKWLAFLSNRSGSSEVWAVDVASGEVKQVTFDGQPKATNSLMSFYEVTK